MESPLAFSLHPFEQSVRADPDSVDVVCTGSFGRGTADQFSDLDVDVWLTERAFNEGLPRYLQVCRHRYAGQEAT